jgi:Zn finger protein HypA/HybF involved in hydrogenase expression
MPLWKCNKCHHEWEGNKTDSKCDWCKNDGKIIVETTPLERMIANQKYLNGFFKRP